MMDRHRHRVIDEVGGIGSGVCTSRDEYSLKTCIRYTLYKLQETPTGIATCVQNQDGVKTVKRSIPGLGWV